MTFRMLDGMNTQCRHYQTTSRVGKEEVAMKQYTTPFVSVVGSAASNIKGPIGAVDAGNGDGLSVLPTNMEQD